MEICEAKVDSDFFAELADVETPERRLWCAVIVQAVRDYGWFWFNKLNRDMQKIRREVDSESFEEICDNAGVNYEAVRGYFFSEPTHLERYKAND